MDQQGDAARGFSLFDQGDMAGAERVFRALVTDGDLDGKGHYGLGLIHLRNGDPRRARTHFLTSLNIDPDNSNAHYYLGAIERSEGNFDGAREHFNDALAIDPAHARAKHELTGLHDPAPRSPDHAHPAPGARAEPDEPVSPPQSNPDHASRSTDNANDFYAMLRRSREPVEVEMAQHLDRISEIIGIRRPRIRAHIGKILLVTLLYFMVGFAIYYYLEFQAYQSRYGSIDPAAKILYSLFAGFVLLIAVIVIDIKSHRIHTDRYWLVKKTGILREDKSALNLFALSRSNASIHRSMWNRVTDDGALELEEDEPDPETKKRKKHKFFGFFDREELEELSSAIRRLSMLHPVDRDILAAIGSLRQIRSGG